MEVYMEPGIIQGSVEGLYAMPPIQKKWIWRDCYEDSTVKGTELPSCGKMLLQG